MNTRILNYAAGLTAGVLSVYILVVGRPLLIPFVIALILAFFIVSISKEYTLRLKIPRGVALFFAIMTVLFVLILIGIIINNSVADVVQASPIYQEKFIGLFEKIYGFFDISGASFTETVLAKINLPVILGSITQMLTGIASNIGLIFIYTVFILLEYRSMLRKIPQLFTNKSDFNQAYKVMDQITTDVNTYIKIKTVVSISTGVLSFIVLKMIGVDFAEFWAFLIFLLNYIPVVGSLVAVLFPITLSLIQFPGIGPFLLVTILLFLIQLAMSNFVEPRLMGKSLNLSPLVILLSLALWGSIWGIIGMIICIPIMVIINITLSKFESTRCIAILFSSSGEIK